MPTSLTDNLRSRGASRRSLPSPRSLTYRLASAGGRTNAAADSCRRPEKLAAQPSSPAMHQASQLPEDDGHAFGAEDQHAPHGSAPGNQVDEPFLHVDHLSVQFGRQQVLRNINLGIPKGQTLVIIGESGCGKTVLLKSMIGLVTPTQGEMHFDGKNLTRLGERELTQQRIRFGYVFQQAALFDSLTVAQNVAFPLRQHGKYSDEEIHDIVRERLEEVGLSEAVVSKKPAELSGGMRKRVGLARALAMNPEVLLYDEPTTGLDPIMTDVINQLILRTRDHKHVTSIVVTHNMQTVQKVPDRVVMLYPLARLDDDEPQILFDGTPHEILEAKDKRVSQFVRGEARERLMELLSTNHRRGNNDHARADDEYSASSANEET